MTDETLSAQAARNELYDIIQRDVSFEEKAGMALELGKQYLGVEHAHLTRIDKATDHWKAFVSTDPPNGRFPAGLEVDLNLTYCRHTIAAEESIALSDVPNQGWAEDTAFQTHGIHCYHGTKLVVGGEPYGTVCFVAEDPRESFSDGETLFAEFVSKLLERELEREQHEAALTKQTNLSMVLNRVLRHNLRNDMSVIRGFAQMMAEELPDSPYGGKTIDKIDDLIELSEKARQLDRLANEDFQPEAVDLSQLVTRVCSNVAEEYPKAAIETDCPENVKIPLCPRFDRAMEELVENAAKHSGPEPTVRVTGSLDPNTAILRVTDDGLGISEQERAVIRSGTETPLEHGSGLGLWLAHWIVSTHNGTMTATVDEGTMITVRIPLQDGIESSDEVHELRRARDQYRAIFDEADDAMLVTNEDGRYIDANPAAAVLFGADTPSELIGRRIDDFTTQDIPFEAQWNAFLERGNDDGKFPIVRPNGDVRTVEYRAVTDIVPGYHLSIIRDITERIERERRFNVIFDQTYQFTGLLEPDGTLIEANQTALSFGGLELDEVIGKKLWDTYWFHHSP